MPSQTCALSSFNCMPPLAVSSIEVTPFALERVSLDIFPQDCTVFLAHIDGTDISVMHTWARRLSDHGLDVVVHLPARSIATKSNLEFLLEGYARAGVTRALVLSGDGNSEAPLRTSQDILETERLQAFHFNEVYFAGHPEGNARIEPLGERVLATKALKQKQDWAHCAGMEAKIVTQFVFKAAPVYPWLDALTAAGVSMPVCLGLAGPTKLKTLITYALACGVGASVSVLRHRARDVTTLLKPYTPDDVIACVHARPHPLIERFHFFPFGGVEATARYVCVLDALA